MSWLVLALAAPLVAAAAWLVWRRPIVALYLFVVGLAFHNAVFLGLWLGHARGWQLTLLQAWKEILLATGLASVAWRAAAERRLPFRPRPLDLAVLALAAVALLYFVLPERVLVGELSLRGRAYGLREVLLPLGAYALGRSVSLRREEWRRLGALVLGVSVVVAALGLIENYAFSLDTWRSAGAKRYYSEQLHFPPFHGPAGLPDNWALNTSDGVFRRLISTYLSPLGTAYMLAVALIVAAVAWPLVRERSRRRLLVLGSAAMLAGFLLAFSRAAALALAGGFGVLALAQRRLFPLAAAAAVFGASVAVAAAFPHVAPRTHFFPEDRAYQEAQARAHGGLAPGSPLSTSRTFSDSSSKEHLSELRRSFESFKRHPGGYGLGASGQIAQRFGGDVAAGESLYLTLAVEMGVAGALALVALVAAALAELAVLARRLRASWLGPAAATLLAAQATVFAIALQTEIWGVPWLVYVLWFLTGSLVTAAQRAPVEAVVPGPEPQVRAAGAVVLGKQW